ncbi:MAG TPA: serine hydrolase domain-containing protein, partial [Steroidobacter sp.]
RHLANHTSGLRDLPSVLALAGWNWLDAVPEAYALDVIARQKHLNFDPGSKYSYSNSGYYLMAVVVERVSGQRFSDFTRDHIFQPLGMLHSRFYDDRRMIMKSRAIGHTKLPVGGFGVWRPTYEIVGDGALLTTVQDMALWDRNFLNPKLGRNPERLLADMTKVGVLNDGKPLEYALGLAIEKYRGLPTVGHGGSVPGYNTFMLRFPEQKFATTILCNVGGGPARVAAKAIADIYLDGKFPEGPETPKPREQSDAPPPAQRQPSVAELQKLAGTYYSEELGVDYTFKVVGQELQASVNYQPPLSFYAVDSRRFYSKQHDLTLTFSGKGFELGADEIQGIRFERSARR